MGMTEDLQEEARLGKPRGSIMREAFMPKVDDSVSGVIPEPEPTAENSYRMSARQSAKIPESVAQARERTDKEQLEWGSQQHNLALQQLQLDPKAQEDAGLAPGQLGSILRGARAGDAQAVDILDILLGQGDTANENVNELRSLLKDPGLSPKDRRAIIAEINKVQSPGREHSFRGALEQKKMDAQAEALEKKQRAAQDQFEARRQDAVTNREDVQENARAMQDQRLQATMTNRLVQQAMNSPVRMSDEQLEMFGATLPPDLKDAVISRVKANQAFLAEENDRKLGAHEIDQKIKAARLDQYEAGKEQDKREEAHRLYNMALDAYKRGLAGGVPLSDEMLGRWVDALVTPLGASSPQALIDSIKSAGAQQAQDPQDQLQNMMAKANMAVRSGQAQPEDYRVLYKDALGKRDPIATALQQKVEEAGNALGKDISDDLIAEMIAMHGGNIRAVMADLDEEIAASASGQQE
jgi:hypothetical protein